MWALAREKRSGGRWKIQLLATLACNPFLSNFFKGKLYRGPLKGVCVPGLNCYSCPAAAASCPIGSLQAVVGAPQYQVSYYVVGILLFLGALLGRGICGFLCPFGWFQELLHKLPTRKYSTRRLHGLTYLKYGVLVVFVILLLLGRIRSDTRRLLIIRGARNTERSIEAVVFEFFSGKANLRVKNTTNDWVEFIYELTSRQIDAAAKKGKFITERLYQIENIEYVNLVSQSDEISG